MGVSGGPDMIQDGLVLSLDASDRNSYVSGSSTWYDLSGFNNSGSLVNGPAFSSANGGSIVFDGVDDYMKTPTVSNFRSICLTMYKTSSDTGGTWRYLIDARPGASNAYISNNQIGAWGNWYINGVPSALSYSLIPTNTWFHFYIQISSPSTSTINFMSRFSDAEVLGGRISQIQIYNRALSASEVLQNYNALKSRFNL